MVVRVVGRSEEPTVGCRRRMTPNTGGRSKGIRFGFVRFCLESSLTSVSGRSSTSTLILDPFTVTTFLSFEPDEGPFRTITNTFSSPSTTASCSIVIHPPPPFAESRCLRRQETDWGGGSITSSRLFVHVSKSHRISHSTFGTGPISGSFDRDFAWRVVSSPRSPDSSLGNVERPVMMLDFLQAAGWYSTRKIDLSRSNLEFRTFA